MPLSDPNALLGRRDLFLLRHDVTFLNHGSFGACPRQVFESYQRWQLELEREPVHFFGRRLLDELDAARAALAEAVGADSRDLALVTNATMGVNIVAQSLALEPGDEVLTTDLEYGAVDNTWDAVCAQRGARVVHAEVPLWEGSRGAIVEAVWNRVTPRTRILSLSHITSGTALILPVEELIARGRQAGIITLIDGAHAPGQLDLDMEALGADYYVGNCHKWLMAPKGSAFLHARREMQDRLRPLLTSHRLSDDTPPELRFCRTHERRGTRDMAAFLAIPEALAFGREQNWDAVRWACHELLIETIQRAVDAFGAQSLVPPSREWFAQMALVPLPPCDAGTLSRVLWQAHRVEVPVLGYRGRSYLRLSIQGYNSREDMDRLIEALALALPRCRVVV